MGESMLKGKYLNARDGWLKYDGKELTECILGDADGLLDSAGTAFNESIDTDVLELCLVQNFLTKYVPIENIIEAARLFKCKYINVQANSEYDGHAEMEVNLTTLNYFKETVS